MLKGIKQLYNDGESYKLSLEQIKWLIKQADKAEELQKRKFDNGISHIHDSSEPDMD